MRKKFKLLMSLVAMLAMAPVGLQAQQAFITDVVVVGADDDDDADWYYDNYEGAGWIGKVRDLNDGAGGHYIHLMYKTNYSTGSSGTAINDFYLRVSDSPGAPAWLTHLGRTYYKVGADGDSQFINSGGDLNCGAGGYYIHLYYTKEGNSPVRCHFIQFDANPYSPCNAVGMNGSTTAADLNLGAGGDDIFMHVYKHLASSPAEIYTEGQLHDAVAITEGAPNLKLMSNINLSKGLIIGDIDHGRSATVTLDLNGHTLNRGLTSSTFLGSVIRVEPTSTLTLNDNSASHTGTITGGRTQQSGGGICNHGTLTVNGCTITGCTANSYGGGIVSGKLTSYNYGVTYFPEMHLNGTTITSCQSTSGGGLGVIDYAGDGLLNLSYATGCTFSDNIATNEGGGAINFNYLELTNCTFTGNTALDVGGFYNAAGGIAVVSGCSFTNNIGTNGAGALANATNAQAMHLTGNTITGNTAGTRGGGIWNGATINMSGSHTITGNTAAGNGGGIYNGGTLNVAGGTLVVNNNTKGSEANNLFLDSGTPINVTGTFNAASDIHVSASNLTAPLTSGYSTHNPGVDPNTLFTADNGRDITMINNEVFQTATLNVEVANYSQLVAAVNNADYNLINITLTDDITMSAGLTIQNNKIVTIDLNGHTINCSNHDHAFTVASGNQLTVTDGSAGQTGTITGATGGAIVNNGTFILDAGTFTGNSTTGHGAALWNGSGATAIINGGSITSNTASGNSAAIWNDGYLTMNSGSVTGNTASYGGLYDGGMLYVQGDVVINNNTNGSDPRNVWLPTGKTINVVGAFTTGASIGFYPENPSQAMTTGYGTHNGSTDPDDIFTADNGYDPNLINNEVCIVNIITVSTESELMAAVQTNAIITLANNIRTYNPINITDNRYVTIDLQGDTIDRGNFYATAAGSCVFSISSGCTLTILDSSDDPSTPEYDGTGVIMGGYPLSSSNDGGGVSNHGTFILDGGTITKNKTEYKAAAIFNDGTVYLNRGIICQNGVRIENPAFNFGGAIYNGGTLYIRDGVRIENHEIRAYGGGIYNVGTLEMTGGCIKDNKYGYGGGGIWNAATGTCTISGNTVISGNEAQSGGAIYNEGTLNITDGSIINNKATVNKGGGIFNNGTINITGGNITGNTSYESGNGGGIWNGGTLNMQGNPVISGNTSNANGNDDVYLKNGHNITVTGAFTEGAHISVLSETSTAVIASGYSTYNVGTNPNSIFSSALGYYMKLNNDGNVIQNVPIGKWIDYRASSFSHIEGSTYYIESEEELALMAYLNNASSNINKYYVLNADLDMSAHEWTPIGTGNAPFMAYFDGMGHTINGIYVNTEGNAGLFGNVKGEKGYDRNIALFGRYSGCGYIKNVTLTNAYIKGSGDVGGIVGYVYEECTIEDCAVEGTIKGGNNAGGIVGKAKGSGYGGFEQFTRFNTPNIKHCLFKDGTVTATGNRATILGTKANDYVDCSRSYYVNPASATGNSSDVRAYRVTKDIPEGIVISYNTSSQGIIHHDTLYYPVGTVHFNVTNDLSLNITSVQVNGTEIGTTWGDYSLTIDPSTAEAYKIKVITEPSSYAGQGTEDNPYEIATTEQWNTMVALLESGGAINNYSGQYFKLMNDITISTMMGSEAHRFKGNFDGNGHTLILAYGASDNYLAQQCAPFLRIDNATIKNLTVAGHIYSSAMLNAGFVGQAYGSGNSIENCVSNVSIHSNKNGDCSNGGFVGKLDNNGTRVTFVGCAFTGELLGENATDWSGFVAWRSNYTNNCNEVSFSHCLFAPTTVNIADGGNNHTFCRATKVAGSSYNNCYYATVLQDGDGGKQAYSITPGENVTVANAADAVATYTVSGITAYNTGFKRNNVLYAGNGQSLSLNLSGAAYNRYIASAGSLSGTENPYTLTMAGSNTVISAWVPSQPTEIATVNDWIEFCTSFSYFDNDYAGMTVNLTANVGPVSTMVGTAAHPFKGTFNGNGHTLTIAFGSEDAYYSEECAPFFRIQNATIENLVIEGSIYGAAMHNGGLVNEAFGAGNVIRNCVSRVSLHSNRGNDCSNAGFVGELNSNGSLVTFEGCAFTGEMVGPGARNWGGFVGWRYWETNNHNSVSFANCLCAPTTVEIDVETSGSNSRVFSRSTNNTTEGATYTNCYYTRNIQEADGGKQARSITSVARVTVANAGTPSSTTTLGVVGYGTGIKFENVNYAANEENVSLNLSYTGTHTDMVQGFSASNGTLTGTENPYTLTLDKNKNVVIYVLMKKNLGANMWYAIASPMHNNGDNETVAGVTNLTTGSYDLMRYNEADGKWESQKSGEGHTGFSTLDQGRGYIYRNSVQTILTFNGEPNSGAIDASITASCADNTIKGFNLVGNPYSTDYAPTVDFYTLNIDGTWRANTHGSSTTVGIAEAFMIHVNAAGTYAFTEPSGAKGAPETPTALAFTVSNEEYSDVAYVRFDGEEGLPKISHLNAEAPMLYVPTAEGRYAIATLEESTERFPLGFNGYGEHTLTVDNSDGFGYLHLLDRATGADIDLLRQPSYTFRANGSGSDRFTVLLSPSMEENDNARFAYWEGHNVVVEGDGELQVFDVMGRELFRREVSTELRIPDSQFPGTGVYVMRLNGKSQKVVIK